ncbi:DinB family protein [Marinoscillum sp. MHG1-6]|uniref:DinB family protein n=1 Tax=Marinoscillum sp. MHG1-6 TaxID=2959627 RepID=UPI002157E9F0|nr:DinB family protein [Marinoscillum sp. MHG1-6]
MTINETIKDLNEVFEGTPWFGQSLSSYIQEIKGDELNFSIDGGNSIGEILNHMIHWRQFVIDKIQNPHGGTETWSIGQTNEADWPKKKYLPSDKDLLVGKLRETQKILIQTLEETPDDLLKEKVIGRDYNFEHMLKGIIHHDIYHLGQLYMLISHTKHYSKA